MVARLVAGLALGWGEDPPWNLLGLRRLGQQANEVNQILLGRHRTALAGQAAVPLGLVAGLQGKALQKPARDTCPAETAVTKR